VKRQECAISSGFLPGGSNKGMTQASLEMKEGNLDTSVILFTMWTESIKQIAENGKGNVIFIDGSVEGMEKSIKI
jgi:prepilin-type processing-associated H-X9-DG protein